MRRHATSLLLCALFVALGVTNARAQFSFLEEPYNQLQVSFMREKQEIDPAASFFNVLRIENPTNRRLRFDVTFSLPAGWRLMGEAKQLVTVESGERRDIPIRAAASPDALGDIGYSVVASLKDNNGKVFKNVYSFVNIPRSSQFVIKPKARTIYFDPLTKFAKLGIEYYNRGNVNELIYTDIKLPGTTKMLGAPDNLYHKDFVLRARTDTTVYYDIELRNTAEADELQDHRLQLTYGGKDTSHNATLWAKNLHSSFTMPIPETDRLLIVELGALNLFNEYPASYEGMMMGNVSISDYWNIRFDFRTMGERFYKDDPWKYSRMLVTTTYRRWRLDLGDVTMPTLLPITGRGARVTYGSNRLTVSATANQNVFNRDNNLGGAIAWSNRRFSIAPQLAFTQQSDGGDKILPGIGLSTRIFRRVRTSLLGGYSIANLADGRTISGMGGNLGLSVGGRDLRWNTNVIYGDPKFAGSSNAKLTAISNLDYIISPTQILQVGYSGNDQVESELRRDTPGGSAHDNHTGYHQLRATYQYSGLPQISIGAGPWLEYHNSNSFYGFDRAQSFSVGSGMANFTMRYRSAATAMNVNADLRVGMSNVMSYGDTYFGQPVQNIQHHERNWLSMVLNGGIRMRNWSLFASYYHGPSTISQHYMRFYNNRNARSVRVMPSMNWFFLKRHLEYIMRGNYGYDIDAEMQRLSLSNMLVLSVGDGWTATFTNTIGYQATIDKVSEEKYSYSNMYFEFRLRKEFGFNQPRFKYVDLDIIFFKDLNGNGVLDPGEPGVDNVLVGIDRDFALADSAYGQGRRGEFYSIEMLSDMEGRAVYRNLVDGFYTIKYRSLGVNNSVYVAEKSFMNVYVDHSQTITIPFQERNKIFGQVLVNRSKLSNLGNIDIANIKVTATDTKGKVYSTLTDKTGHFVIYVPNVEKYTVAINNIFREHFELEQNSFEVQLNGYKQFELTFIFTEKQRKINFNTQLSFESQSQQVQVVRRTNLNGTVRDASTGATVRALVRVIDDRTGEVVTETRSDSRTGSFYATFASGPGYSLHVTADDYWFYSEPLQGDQITSFLNLQREVLLVPISAGGNLELRNVVFASGDSELSDAAKIELQHVIEILQANPNLKIKLVGHCDDIEAIDDAGVSERRVKAALKFMLDNGYTNALIESAGASRPLVDEASEQARALNRRVEAVVVVE